MASKAASIVFVTGSFAPPYFYDNMTNAIREKGYEFEVVHLKSVTKKPGNPTMYDDAEHIASIAEKYADQGKDVVLIAHSYGGLPTTQCARSVSKVERAKSGKKGGVVGLGYMTAVVPALGKTLGDTMDGQQADYLKVDEDGWMYHSAHEETAKWVFNQLPPEEGLAWSKKFEQHSAISFAGELTDPGYKDLPSSWLFCEDDKCVDPGTQQKGIDNIEASSGKKVDVTRIPTDHCPSILHPDWCIDWIVSVATKSSN